ncbi:protein adenylyltransferase SelO [Maritalea porphyrae]|uniref:protein adenylyltransferase SelO n=1 Tax=Maritalea porphyrae TaxID=880732 RepID=UPI0022AF02D2|nr:YdiU family protein [Maritalea porphyrae]MCZ4271974.1 YdiU family protein [Maritalea porphyrae]
MLDKTTPIFGAHYAQLPDRFYAEQPATPVAKPSWIAFNKLLAEDLQLDATQMAAEAGLAIFAGNQTAPGTVPLAMAYSGHQFGHWNPSLGDGRALLLGDVTDKAGQRFDIQLKGSGPTPFSRNGDGRAALGPVLREYVLSEAMNAMGIATTRALAAVSTGEKVRRETPLPGAIITRVAKSFVRVGTFQYFVAHDDKEGLMALADFSIERHEPDLKGTEYPYLELLKRVVSRQAHLIASWQLIGFIHGVMNTDNVSIAGETIDYGPCAFMDQYDPATVFSSIDSLGRYAYQNQPRIGQWNLSVLAQSMLPILHEDEDQALALAQDAINEFSAQFDLAFRAGLLKKIGIVEEQSGDYELAIELLDTMKQARADFTNTFRALSNLDLSAPEIGAAQLPLTDWVNNWLRHTDGGKRIDQNLMRLVNPAFIPRNHRIEAMIQAATRGDFSLFHELMEVLATPFEDKPIHHAYTLPPAPDERVHQTFCGT